MSTSPARNPILAAAAAAALCLPASVGAQAPTVVREEVDLSVVERIREEGLERSRVEEMARHLTEVIGHRLTNSPGMRRANAWTQEKFAEWGLENRRLEPWGEFGRGWSIEFYGGRIVEPFIEPLEAEPVAWTGSTDGRVSGRAMILEAESAEELEIYRGRLEGAFVLLQGPVEVGPEFESPDRRRSLESMLEPAEDRADGRREMTAREWQERIREYRRMRALGSAVAEIGREEGVLAILEPSNRQYGIIGGAGGRPGRDPDAPEPVAQLAVAAEQYNQIWRNVRAGVPVTLEVEVRNRFHDDDLRAYNTLADLPGTDLADEYVMIGGHLDSWHEGNGATDNGGSCVVMMEAMRILKALDLKPRRTIRIALWSGEEQGLLGSRAWVRNHPELHGRISAYLNLDNGTGRIRGMRTQGNQAAIPIFEQILWPFEDLGVVVVNDDENGGTDHLSFDAAGIPGFNWLQDPIEYALRTHHSSVDTFDHLVIDDLKQAAVVVAFTAWHLANRDEMVPRKEAGAAPSN